jgi:HSP20 family molecular chaperone IbpA
VAIYLEGTRIEARAMPNTQPLKPGQEVFLKRPIQIYAKVIGPCDGDWGLPEGEAPYAVELLPLAQFYLAEDLEISGRPQVVDPLPDTLIPQAAEDPGPVSERAPNFSARDSFGDLAREVNDLIAVRAYEIYESRGFSHGHDQEDWLLAASEILENVPVEISETETSLTVRAGVTGFTHADLEVRVVPRALCIRGKRGEAPEKQSSQNISNSERCPARIFCVLDLPSEIDPARVEAFAGGGVLEIQLVKMGSRKVVPVRAKSASA